MFNNHERKKVQCHKVTHSLGYENHAAYSIRLTSETMKWRKALKKEISFIRSFPIACTFLYILHINPCDGRSYQSFCPGYRFVPLGW